MKDKFYYYFKRKVRITFLAQIMAGVLAGIWLLNYRLQRNLARVKPAVQLPDSKQARKLLAQNYYERQPEKHLVKRSWAKPTVDLSILMEVNNAEKFLVEALESALNQQTKYQFEVIAILAHSTDGSQAILEQYQDRVQYEVYEQMDSATVRNRLLDLAHGEYITYLDADDVLSNEAVEKWLQAATERNADLVQCSYYTYDHQGVIDHFDQGTKVIEAFNEENFMDFPGFNCMKIIRRQLFAEIAFPKGYQYEDTLLAFLIYPQVKCAVSLSDELYGYRQHGNNFSRNPGKTVIDTFWIVEQLFMDAKGRSISPAYLNYLMSYQLGPMLYNRMSRENVDNLQAVFQLACDLKAQLPLLSEPANPLMRDLQQAFAQRNFKLWKLSAAMI